MPLSELPWAKVWESKGGIWNVLTSTVFKQFPVEQLARNYAKSVTG